MLASDVTRDRRAPKPDVREHVVKQPPGLGLLLLLDHGSQVCIQPIYSKPSELFVSSVVFMHVRRVIQTSRPPTQ
jgi:transcriptional regulatory protein LevR